MSFLKRILGNPDLTLQIRGGAVPVQLIPKVQALAAWQKAAAEFPKTGRWPILLDPEMLSEERMDQEGTAEEVLQQSREVDLKVLRERLEAENELDEEDLEECAPLRETDPTTLDVRVTGQTVPALIDLTKGGQLGLALMPVQAPYEILAHRAFGGWNSVPYDHELIAVLKDFDERYGAKLISLTHDVLELWVERPITDPVVACEAAKEQYALCPDIVDQGTESVQALAQGLLNARVWFFWWD